MKFPIVSAVPDEGGKSCIALSNPPGFRLRRWQRSRNVIDGDPNELGRRFAADVEGVRCYFLKDDPDVEAWNVLIEIRNSDGENLLVFGTEGIGCVIYVPQRHVGSPD